MVNPPECVRSLLKIILLLLKYNFSCYGWIFKFYKKQAALFFDLDPKSQLFAYVPEQKNLF